MQTALAAILMLAKVTPQTPPEVVIRFERLATEWASAVRVAPVLPVVCADGSRCADASRASVLALVGIAYHESNFGAAIEDCSGCALGGPHCDRGRAITMFQIQNGFWNGWNGNTRQQMCRDNQLAASVALVHLTKRRVPITAAFLAYAGRTQTGNELIGVFERLIARVPLKVVHLSQTTVR